MDKKFLSKEKREKLREECQKWIGNKDYYYPAEAETTIGLLDHIDALERQVEAAYKEGYERGCGDVHAMTGMSSIRAWANSKAKAAIASAQEGSNETN